MIKGGEKKSDKIVFREILPELCSFVIPVFVVALAFFNLGIYPGGRSTLLTYDLKALFLALYGNLSNAGPGYDTIFHSMSGGLGGNYYATYVLCISPLDFIYSFVPVKYLPEAIYFMVLAKIGLCGLACSIYLKKNNKIKVPALMVVLLSCCYALMSYNFMYFMAPMWYDAVILLPILALSLEKLISGKNSPAFTFLMAFCIICDYYIAYMVVIALVLYFLFRLSEEKINFKAAVRRFIAFAVHGIISAGMSMFVILPSVLDFKRGKLAEGVVSETGNFIKNSFFDVLKSFKPQSYAGLDFDASPNIFCGTIILILVICWLCYGKKNIRSRVCGLIIIAFYFLSFILGPLDRMWHGFRDPVCFSVRYSFTFVFFMVCFATRGLMALSENKERIKDGTLRLISFIVVFYTFIELYLNGSFILAGIGTEAGYNITSEYKKICEVQENLVPYDLISSTDGYGRIVSNYKYSSYDGALFGYDGLARFSSSYNYKSNMFFRSMGLNTIYHSLGEKGMTPPVASLIDGRYILSYWIDQSDYYEPLNTYAVYTLNENTNALPLAFEVNSSCTGNTRDFVESPFENINAVYQELFADDGEQIEIFVPENVVSGDKDLEYSFTATHSGHYYMFVEYKYDDEDNLEPDEEAWEFSRKKIIRNYNFNDESAGEYGNNQYSYCVELGVLEEGKDYFLKLESSASEEGQVYVSYFDQERFEQIISQVNGCKLIDIGKKGIKFTYNTEQSSDLLVTLPYEDGYQVFVDGEKIEYKSYRDCMIVIPVESGFHDVSIKFVPPGFVVGLIISVLFFAGITSIVVVEHISRNNGEENEQ